MTSLLPDLIVAVIACAAITIAAEYIQPRRRWLTYVFKPLTTILILAAALLPGSFLTSAYARAIATGLLFSLMGDIWFMLPRDRFIQGLASFLAAHICYIVAFRGGVGTREFAWVAAGLALVGTFVLRYLWLGIPKPMRPAALLYGAAILIMAALAVGAALGEPSPRTVLAGTGALLFVVSDGTLSINRFRRPFHWAEAVVLSTYFVAQLLIGLSVAAA